jgi:hypothetical protein
MGNEDLRKHLDLIQAVITRMASNSFLIKGWAVTLVSAVLAFAADKDKLASNAWIGFFPVFLFWGLDAYYLWQEQMFRDLYDVARKETSVDFSLNAMAEAEKTGARTYKKAFTSPTVKWLYVSLLITVGAVWAIGLVRVYCEPPKTSTTTAATSTTSPAPAPGTKGKGP